MDLELLNRFVTLAKLERINFSHAAETLKIPQPHLSQQIKRLEQELGVTLFNRNKRPPELTPAGQEFLRETIQILSRLEVAKLSTQRIHRGELGHLNIGVNASTSNSIFPQIFQAFREAFPYVSIHLGEMASYQQIAQLQNRQLDVGFFHLHNLQALGEQNEFALMPVLREGLVIALPEQHPLAQQGEVNIADLRDDNFILPSPLIGGLRSQILDLCQQAGFMPAIKQEAAWITTFLSLVACNVGVAILPANAQNLQRTGVVYRSLQGESPTLDIVAVWKQDYVTTTLQNFLTLLQTFAETSRIL